MDTSKQPHVSKKHRSPNYPAFPLGEAIAKAKIFYEHEKNGSVPAALACEHWGLKATGSSGMRCLSTMLSFGLLEDSGIRDEKKVRLSERGKVLVRHPDQESEEYRTALREAALSPAKHRELWDHWNANGAIPSDKALAWSLEKDHGFAGEAIDLFIAEIRETFDLAKLVLGAKTESDPPTPSPPPLDLLSQFSPRPSGSEKPMPIAEAPRAPQPLQLDGPMVRFPLGKDNVLEVRLRSRVSRSEFEKIRKIIELAEDSFVRSDGDDQ